MRRESTPCPTDGKPHILPGQPLAGLVIVACLAAAGLAIYASAAGAQNARGPLPATQPASQGTDLPRRVSALIAELSDDSYEKRVAAEGELVKIGLPAVSPLRRATSGRDPERALRARNALARIADIHRPVECYLKATDFLLSGGSRLEAAERFQTVADMESDEASGSMRESSAELAEALRTMAGEDAAFQPPPDPSALTGKQRVDYLVFQLRDIAAREPTVPGKCRVLFDAHSRETAAHQLRRMGKSAVPTLLGLLEDRRPTRSSGAAMNGGRVLRYCDVALEVLEAISCQKFDDRTERGAYLSTATAEQASQIIQRVRQWWRENRDGNEPEWIRRSLEQAGVGAMQDRLAGAERLIELEGAGCVDFFGQRLAAEPDNGNVVRLLWLAGGKDVLTDLRQAAQSRNPAMRGTAYRYLLEGGQTEYVARAAEDLAQAVSRSQASQYDPLLDGLVWSTNPSAVVTVARYMANQDPEVAAKAMRAVLQSQRCWEPQNPGLFRELMPYVMSAVDNLSLDASRRFGLATWLVKTGRVPLDWPAQPPEPEEQAAKVRQLQVWWQENGQQFLRLATQPAVRDPSTGSGLDASPQATQPGTPATAPGTVRLGSPQTQPGAGETRPTAGNLQQWLTGKEVAEVCFAGPHMDPLKLRDSLKTKVSENDWDFRLTPGEGGGANRAFVTVRMKATPENVRRLLALQAELHPRGYRLDPAATRVWSYEGDAEARKKAQGLVPEMLAAVQRGIEQAVPGAQCSPEKAGIRYELPGTSIRGMIRVHEVTALKRWELAVGPDQVMHLPHVGLMIMAYYRPGQPGADKDASPEHEAIRQAVAQAVQPLLALEALAPAPTTQPAAEGTSTVRQGSPQTHPASGPGSSPEGERIRELIGRLGGRTYQERDAAQNALVALGKAAAPALRQALDDPDPERAARAKKALNAIKQQNARIAIYLVSQPGDLHEAEKCPLKDLKCGELILSEEDIRSYDWKTHTMRLEPGVARGVLAMKIVHAPFVVIVDRRPCYLGAFRSDISSYLPQVPCINVGITVGPAADTMQPKDCVCIVPSPRAGAPDPRDDARLKQAVLDLGLLVTGEAPSSAQPAAGGTSTARANSPQSQPTTQPATVRQGSPQTQAATEPARLDTAAGLKIKARPLKDRLPFGERPRFDVTLTNVARGSLDIIGPAEFRGGRPGPHYPCASLTIRYPDGQTSHQGNDSARDNPRAERIAPGATWSFRFPPEADDQPARPGAMPSLSALLPGKYTAELWYFTRDAEIQRLGAALVFGPGVGALSGQRPRQLWQGAVCTAPIPFEVLDDDSEPLAILRAVHAGKGGQNLRLELRQETIEVDGRPEAALRLRLRNVGGETIHLGSEFGLVWVGPDGRRMHDFGGPRSGRATALAAGGTEDPGGWSFGGPGRAPGQYEVWAQYLTPSGKLLAESNHLTIQVPPADKAASQGAGTVRQGSPQTQAASAAAEAVQPGGPPVRLDIRFDRDTYLPTEDIHATIAFSTDSQAEIALWQATLSGDPVGLFLEVTDPSGAPCKYIGRHVDGPPFAHRITRDRPHAYTWPLRRSYDWGAPGEYRVVARYLDRQRGQDFTSAAVRFTLARADGEKVLSTWSRKHQSGDDEIEYISELVQVRLGQKNFCLARQRVLNPTIPGPPPIAFSRRIEVDGLDRVQIAAEPTYDNQNQAYAWKVALSERETLLVSIAQDDSGRVGWVKVPRPAGELDLKLVEPGCAAVFQDKQGKYYSAALPARAPLSGRRTLYLGLDLTDLRGQTDSARLPDLFEERPPGSKSFVLRSGVEVVHQDYGGTVYRVRQKDLFYVQHAAVGSSQQVFHGPYAGDPRQRLTLPAPATQPATDPGSTVRQGSPQTQPVTTQPATQGAARPGAPPLREMLVGLWQERANPRQLILRADGTFQWVQTGLDGWTAAGRWELSGRLLKRTFTTSPRFPAWVGRESLLEVHEVTLEKLELRTRGGPDISIGVFFYERVKDTESAPATRPATGGTSPPGAGPPGAGPQGAGTRPASGAAGTSQPALRMETWRNRWEGMALSLEILVPGDPTKSLHLSVDPQGRAAVLAWDPAGRMQSRYEGTLPAQDLAPLVQALGQAQPWNFSKVPKWPGRPDGGRIRLTLTVDGESAGIEQPWPPPEAIARTPENELAASALMGVSRAATIVAVLTREAAVRAQAARNGAPEVTPAAGATTTAPAAGDARSAVQKVIDLLELPSQVLLTEEQLDRAAESLRAAGDPAVEAVMKRYDQTRDNSFRHRAVQVLQRLGTPRARAALLDIALGRTRDDLPSSHDWAAGAYVRSARDKADARRLLDSDESAVLNTALLALKGQPVDEPLLKRLREISQRKEKNGATWMALRFCAANVLAADPRAVLVDQRVDLILAMVADVANMPDPNEVHWPGNYLYSESACAQLASCLAAVPGADEALTKAAGRLGGVERDIACLALGYRGNEKIRGEMLRILRDEPAGMRRAWAARVLGVIGTAEDLPVLRELAESDGLQRQRGGDVGPEELRTAPVFPVRQAAALAIREIEARAARATQPATDRAAARPAAGEGDIQRQVAGLIRQLSDADYRQRDAAEAALVEVGLPAIASLEKAAAGGDAERAARAASAIRQIRKAHRPVYSVVLPSGVTLELVGLSNYPDQGRPWWGPDGLTLDQPPVEPSNSDITSSSKPDERKVELLFRLGGKAVQPGFDCPVRRADGQFMWWAGRRFKEGRLVPDFKCVGTSVPSDRQALDIRLQVAAGPWRTVFTGAGRKPNGLVKAVEQTEAGVTVRADFDPDKEDGMVVAVDAKGTEYRGMLAGIRRGDGARGADFLIRGLRMDDIASLRFETRKYEVVELVNVSLEPGHDTSPRLVCPGAATQSASQGASTQGTTTRPAAQE